MAQILPDHLPCSHIFCRLTPVPNSLLSEEKRCGSRPRRESAISDFSSGVAVNVLGHAHPVLVEALTDQAHKLWHVSNLFQMPEAEKLAKRLCSASFADVVFFANSGAEAMEAAIKTARKYHFANGQPERVRVITFEGAFHGRTLATLAAGGQQKYLEGFGPVAGGFDQVAFGDIDAVKKAITPETAAIIMEPVQGEGGVRVVPAEFMRAMRELCDKHGLMLVFDEVQTGLRPHWRIVRLSAQRYFARHHGARQSAGWRLPDRRMPCHGRSCEGHDRRRAWLDHSEAIRWRRASAMPCSMLCWRRASSITPQRMALLLKQRLAELKDRHCVDHFRSAGRRPADRPAQRRAQWRTRRRLPRRKSCCTVAAGDNVVRLLPPLIISRGRYRRSHRHDRSGLHASCRPSAIGQQGCIVMANAQASPFHRPDRGPSADLRSIIASARAMKKSKGGTPRQAPARQPDPGDDFRQAIDPHAHLFRGRNASAWRRRGHADRGRRCNSAAADPFPIRRG